MELKEDYKKFQREISKRGIEYLIHFTPTINLCSILKQGKLISREMLESSNIDFILDYIQFTDEVRLDGKGWINLSISAPNTYLFSRFRKKTENDPTIHWCILKIDPKHIYEKETKFAVTNAATAVLKTRPEIGITGDIDKFKMLFADEIKYIKIW